jgi:GNAT superfamily N-acetyltransferase
MSADPELLATWVRGWALTRGAPAPVRDRCAWRIDVDQTDQIARYVYAEATQEAAERAVEIREPFVFLKICDGAEAVQPLLDARWAIQPPGFMMTLDGTMGGSETPTDYRFEVEPGTVTFVRLLDAVGEEAARGRATVVEDRIIFDRIATAPAHRRRGLASAIMRELEAVGRARGGREGVLVATGAGRALYERLGWRMHSPYTTAVIPG